MNTHKYPDPDGTSDCLNGCGCWMGPFRAGGPEGVDPFGACPKAPPEAEAEEAPAAADRPRLYRDRSGRCEAHAADVCEVCPGDTLAAALAPMVAIGELLRTQDNRVTAHPIFLVEQSHRVWGVDEGWTDTFKWVRTDSDEEVPDDLEESLELGFGARRIIPKGFARVGYKDVQEFVTACFTEAAADRYIAENRHNLTAPRVFAASGYRNREWIGVREFLLSLAPIPPAADGGAS